MVDDASFDDLQAQVLMLQQVTASLWSNFIHNSGETLPEVMDNLDRCARENTDSIEGLYERLADAGPDPDRHEAIQRILHHAEKFWKGVEVQVERFAASRGT